MAMTPKPIKITGTATGTKDKATNYKDTQKISKVPTRVTAGITGPGKANVTKPYQQMEESKKNVTRPTAPNTMAPKKTRSALESNRMQ